MKFIIIIFLLINISFSKDTLNVVVTLFEPFAMKQRINNDPWKYVGFDIELWEMIAKEINVETKIIESSFENIFKYVESGTADIGMSAISINYSREKNYDFSTPYKKSGLGILVKNEKNYNIIKSLKGLFTGNFLKVWIALFVFVIITAHLIWLAERGSDAFDDKYKTGIWQGLWWAFVTVSTVGYGDKVPKKPFSKVVAVFVIMAGIAVAGLAFGQLSAIIEMDASEYSITCKENLKGKKVGCVKNTTSVKAVNKLGAYCVDKEHIEHVVDQLEKGEVDAVVFDIPVLEYIAKNNPNVIVVSKPFDLQDYGILMIQGSSRKEEIDQAILYLIENGKHQELKEKWFGT
jgi:polar amino acid transport system substrate-binding protein